MRLVPLPKRSGVDVDDAGFHECLGSEKLVVGGVVSLKTVSALVPPITDAPVPEEAQLSRYNQRIAAMQLADR